MKIVIILFMFIFTQLAFAGYDLLGNHDDDDDDDDSGPTNAAVATGSRGYPATTGLYGSYGGGYSTTGGYGPGAAIKIEENDSLSINRIANNLVSLSRLKNYDEGAKKEYIDTILKQYSLDKDPKMLDKVLNRTYQIAAQKVASFETTASDTVAVTYKKSDLFDELTKNLNRNSISFSGYSESKMIKDIVDNSTDAKSYLKELKDRLGVNNPAYKAALTDGFNSFASNIDDSKNFIYAMAESGIDQNFLGMMISARMMNAGEQQEPDEFMKLIGKYYDFATIPESIYGISADNLLCSTVFYLKQTIAPPPPPSENEPQYNNFSSQESTYDPNSKEFIELQKAGAKTARAGAYFLIKLGADQNITCADGRKFSDIIKDLKDAEVFEKDDFLFGNLKATKPCISNPDRTHLPGLCDVSKVLVFMQEQLQKNEEHPNKSSTNTFVGFYNDEKCNITVFDKNVGQASRTISASIRPKHSLQDIGALSASTKEAFLKDLEKIIKTPAK